MKNVFDVHIFAFSTDVEAVQMENRELKAKIREVLTLFIPHELHSNKNLKCLMYMYTDIRHNDDFTILC